MDDAISDEVDHDEDEDEDEGDVRMENGAEAESKDDDGDGDDEILHIDDKENDPESMDEELDDTYDLEYHQNEAMEKLSTIFKLLNIDPIHDK